MSFYGEMKRQQEEAEWNIKNIVGVGEFKRLMESNFEVEKQGECCQTCDRVRKCNCPVQGKVPPYAKHCEHYKSE